MVRQSNKKYLLKVVGTTYFCLNVEIKIQYFA